MWFLWALESFRAHLISNLRRMSDLALYKALLHVMIQISHFKITFNFMLGWWKKACCKKKHLNFFCGQKKSGLSSVSCENYSKPQENTHDLLHLNSEGTYILFLCTVQFLLWPPKPKEKATIESMSMRWSHSPICVNGTDFPFLHI